jgi:hypothetical protein
MSGQNYSLSLNYKASIDNGTDASPDILMKSNLENEALN